MRLFLAIEVPDNVRAHLVTVRDELKRIVARGSFPRDENLHITLKFLGDVEATAVSKLSESMRLVRAGGAINLFAHELQCFPERGAVGIVATGFSGDMNGIDALHRAIEQRCQHLGFERETRRYRPHVTLVRARPALAPAFRKTAGSLASQFPGPAFRLTHFALVESNLRADGSEYRILEGYGFAQPS
jgi:2'-5' RNA ligase